MENEELAILIEKLLESKPDVIDRLEILSNLIGDYLEPLSKIDQEKLLKIINEEILRKLNK